MLKSDNSSITVSSGFKMLDFTIDTTGVGMFVSNCAPVESKKSTYSIGKCTTINCNTIDCTTVNCTTIKCNSLQCYGYEADCRCDCCSDS